MVLQTKISILRKQRRNLVHHPARGAEARRGPNLRARFKHLTSFAA